MASKTSIEWTTHTWNPIGGCSVLSPGCTNCYAMKTAARLAAMNQSLYKGLTQTVNGRAVWTGEMRKAARHVLLDPLRSKKPTTYFVNSMSDLFHENVPDEWIDEIFAVMALCPQHTFQLLTKRAQRMQDYCASDATLGRVLSLANSWLQEDGMIAIKHLPDGLDGIVLPNVWLGVSTERQQEYDERKEHLRNTPAAVRFFSMEPLLGPIIADYLGDWVIVGGESGPRARDMEEAWAESLRDQCGEAGVPFFLKQMTRKAPIPPHLFVREYPKGHTA